MNNKGYSIVEALMAMTIFTIGVLALANSYMGITRSLVQARNQELETQCARDRLEEIVNTVKYADITGINYPSEDFGDVNGGDSQYAGFSRSVAIRDSLNAIGTSVLKEITITVNWQAVGDTRSTMLNSVIARHKDLQL